MYTCHGVGLTLKLCVCTKQVANLNPKDNTYALKDFIYRDVQRDWPGYSEDEKTQVDRILARYRTALLKFQLHSEL